MSFSSLVLVVSLLLTGSYAASAPFKVSDDKPADKLVAAAQSVLQKAGKSVAAAQNDTLGVGRHKGDRFTSPVDGYFIQVKVAYVYDAHGAAPPTVSSHNFAGARIKGFA